MAARLGNFGQRVAGVAVAGSAIAMFGNNFIFNVDAGHRAVMFNRSGGVSDHVKDEGTHFMIPFFQRPIIFDVRIQAHSVPTQTGTKDLQTVSLSLRVLYRPKIDMLPKIYKDLNVDYMDRVLPSVVNEVLKAEVARHNAEHLLTMRDTVSQQIKEAITKRCQDFNIIIEDVSLTHLAFSKDFSKAIEEKQVAMQMAERSKFVVMRTEQEKAALIIKSEGDSTAAKLVSEALSKSGDGLLEIRRIETALEIAEVLSKSRNVTYLPSGSQNMLLNLNNPR